MKALFNKLLINKINEQRKNNPNRIFVLIGDPSIVDLDALENIKLACVKTFTYTAGEEVFTKEWAGKVFRELIYENQDKSSEDRVNEPKGSNGKGNERLSRYTDLINVSTQLKSLPEYRSSVYYQEPFYQLMRQTLWAENILKNHEVEKLKADDYLHVHVIPKANHDLLNKTYKVSGKTMEETWRSMLSDQSKYVIVDPQDLMKPIFDLYPELTEYLRLRYW